MTLTLPDPDDLSQLNDKDLKHRRIQLLRRRCPPCDLGQFQAPCTCEETEAEVARIEAEQERRREI